MQTPRSILLHLDTSSRCAERVKLAAQLAQRFDAEVTAMLCTMPALMRFPYAMESTAEAVTLMQDLDQECREKAHAVFEEAGAGSPRLHWVEQISDAPWGFARRALYADLMILGQRNVDDASAGELPPDFLPSLLVESGKPALVLPYAGPIAQIGRTVLVAWKETPESARALSASLPWLCGADRVHVVCYDHDPAPALGAVRDYLAVAGVPATTTHAGGPDRGEAGNSLLSLAADLGADLLVMGCYGHSRAREWVLGGVTRSILQSMTLPVLMAH
jgi:nucleotide-binding universal stress UspA family protein